MIGMRRRLASCTAISSVLRSMTKTASGRRVHVLDAAEVGLELGELGFAAFMRSLVGSRSSWPSAF